jgi:hypothetical protein
VASGRRCVNEKQRPRRARVNVREGMMWAEQRWARASMADRVSGCKSGGCEEECRRASQVDVRRRVGLDYCR